MLYYIQQKKEVKDMKKLLLVIMIAILTYMAGAYTTIVTQEIHSTPTGYEVIAYGHIWDYE